MTAITTKASVLTGIEVTSQEDAQRRRSMTPSTSEAEAKTRFVSALNRGVDTLLDRGHGRDRASTELLTEIADGCSPDEDEIFQAMELYGISLKDATKAITISAAFRNARNIKGGSTVAAVDELTSRLNLANISRKGSPRSPSPSPSVTSTHSTPSSTAKMSAVAKNESAASSQNRPSAVAKKGQRSTRSKSHQQGKGRKRALAEKTPENPNANVMLVDPKNKEAAAADFQVKGRKRALAEKTPENPNANVILEEPKNKEAAAADFQVKEKIAKLSKADGKKPKSMARATSPEGLGVRGKRTAAPHVEEVHSNKRPRIHTEESIPTI